MLLNNKYHQIAKIIKKHLVLSEDNSNVNHEELRTRIISSDLIVDYDRHGEEFVRLSK
jgi:hypothetical protein